MLVWQAYSRTIDALAFSPCGRALALGGYHLACLLIDPATGEPRWRKVPGKQAFGLSLAFAPDGSVLCKCGPLSTRSAADGSELSRCGNWCRAFGLAPDGRAAFVADGGFQDVVRRYDLATGSPCGEVELEAGAIKRIAVSPAGRRVAALGSRRFHLLAADSLKVLASEGHRALSTGAFALAFSPDGRTLVYTAGRELFVWDVPARREVRRVDLGAKHALDAAFTPCGRRLITVGKEGAARVWETAGWTCERVFAWEVGPLRAVAVAPDGTRAATAGDAGRVVVWDLDA
jgi:WD40 repeat protein